VSMLPGGAYNGRKPNFSGASRQPAEGNDWFERASSSVWGAWRPFVFWSWRRRLGFCGGRFSNWTSAAAQYFCCGLPWLSSMLSENSYIFSVKSMSELAMQHIDIQVKNPIFGSV